MWWIAAAILIAYAFALLPHIIAIAWLFAFVESNKPRKEPLPCVTVSR